MENLTTTHQKEIRECSEIIIPAGTGKTNFVAAYDIAEVAYRALTEGQSHYNKAYELTGPEAYDYYQVAQILSNELDRTISYHKPSIIRFIAHRRSYGDSWAYIAVMIGLYTVARLGLAAGYSDLIHQLLHRAPTTLAEFVHENREKLMSR
jgi:nucleoside-diphosphate-sugar epimerase